MPRAFTHISAHFPALEWLCINGWSESNVLISISHDWKEHKLKSDPDSEQHVKAPNEGRFLIKV